MNPEWLKATVGTIVTNLQSLEFASRLFLETSVGPADTDLHIDRLEVGDIVAEGHLTNYDTLGQVLHKLNARWAELGLAERVDEDVVAVRDGFAHGRVIASDPQGPFRLVKFDRPKKGLVPVVTVFDLTEDWLRREVKRTGDELFKVVRVSRQQGLECFPDD